MHVPADKPACVVPLGWSQKPLPSVFVLGVVWCLLNLHLLCCQRADLRPVTGLRDGDMWTLVCLACVVLLNAKTLLSFCSFLFATSHPCPCKCALLSSSAAPVRRMAFGVPAGSFNTTYFVLCGGGLTAALVYVSISHISTCGPRCRFLCLWRPFASPGCGSLSLWSDQNSSCNDSMWGRVVFGFLLCCSEWCVSISRTRDSL